MKRTLAVLALTGSLAMISGGAAMATTYPAPPPGVAVSDGTVTPGAAVTFSGFGFTPGERVRITVTLNGLPGAAGGVGSRSVPTKIVLPAEALTLSVVADAEGKFSTPVTLLEAGTYTLTAVGEASGRTQSATVTAASTQGTVASASDGNLPETGADSNLYLWGGVGGAALALGIASVVIVRKKANAEEAA